jgi:putative ABC transport system ATP-binding protein
MTVALEAKGLTKTYRSDGEATVALRGVDITLQEGEFVSIMGPSGCGKSTLLHLLGGLDRADGGEITLSGKRVEKLSEAAWSKLRRRSVGYMFQFFNLIGSMSAAENVELPALIAGVGPAEAKKRREALFEELGIAGRASRAPARLSGGEQQRVALARALINRPEVLMADEPTGNLDSRSAREVMAMLGRIHGEGQTLLLVTHDPRVAAAGDRVVRIRDGRVVTDTDLEREAKAGGPAVGDMIALRS